MTKKQLKWYSERIDYTFKVMEHAMPENEQYLRKVMRYAINEHFRKYHRQPTEIETQYFKNQIISESIDADLLKQGRL